MVLINGRKHACLSCIRGHRASSCSHTGRQLQPIRSKGRPSSQCDTCKEKRARGGFHGKCECGRSNSVESISQYSDTSMVTTAEGSNQWRNDEKEKYSLEKLMNPCKCKFTGTCTCCNSGTTQFKGQIRDDQFCDASCCDLEMCCSADVLQEECAKEGAAACCGGGVKMPPSHVSLPTIRENQRNQEETQKRSDCRCGSTCNCPQCSRHVEKATYDLDDCPGLCLNCSACLSGLTRPSGIKAVDEWMERDSGRITSEEESSSELASGIQKSLEVDRGHFNPARYASPPLPPFPQAAAFFTSHFLDDERRRYFSQQLQGQDAMVVEAVEESPTHLAYGQSIPGETDEDWQIRHGYYHLTPSAVKIFDAAREFKESRKAQEEEDEGLTPDTYPAVREPISVTRADQTQELEELRRKALSARKQVNAVTT